MAIQEYYVFSNMAKPRFKNTQVSSSDKRTVPLSSQTKTHQNP